MSVTWRFAAVLLAGVPVFIGAAALGAYWGAFWAYNAICAALLLVDYLALPKSGRLNVKRAGEDKLYYKAENTVTIFMHNAHKRKLRVEMTDDLPDWHFGLIGANPVHVVEPGEEKAFEYAITATKRGSFKFDRVHMRVAGPLGLCRRYYSYSLPIEMKVYPNVKDLSKYRLMVRKNRLLQAGERRVSIKGVGTEFESLREYVEGDDYRSINWNNSARERKLIVNQYEAEKNQPVFMLLDAGRPMSYSVKGYKKLDYAINASLVLSDIVNRGGDNSGLIVFDTEVRSVIMPGKGENHRSTFMDALYHVEDTKNTSDYEGVFQELISRQKRRGLVFIFTDFETLEEARLLTESIGIIIRRHIPVIVLMKNDSVIKLAAGGDKTLLGAYTRAVALRSLQERKNIMKALNARGVPCIETDSENFALAVVNQYLSIKNRSII